jgi:plasmid stabilization system protein ParE
MPELIWSPQALADVQRIYRFLNPKNPDAARRAVAAIRAGVRILARQPEIGRPADEIGPEYREWLIDFGNSGYIVRYRLDRETAVLLAIRHQREAGYG